MFADLARDEIEQLEEQGIRLTAEEVVRLNGLALQALSPVAEWRRPRRIAWARNCRLLEPSISAEEWMRDIIPLAAADEMSAVWLRAFACSTEPETLWQLMDFRSINKAVQDWRRGLQCTAEELANALLFVTFGNNEAFYEAGGRTLATEADKLAMCLPPSDDLTELVQLCKATHIALDKSCDTIEDLQKTLCTYRAEEASVDEYRKRMVNRARALFYAALDEIKAKHQKDSGNG